MNPLNLQPTDDTPNVSFNYNNSSFEISGRSLPEDSISFYTPVIEWLKNYVLSPSEESNFVFHFEYVSTSSTKQIMKLIIMIDELTKTNKTNVYWKYDKDDDDMLQTGKRLQKLTTVDFKYVEV
jgi:hypothetical protein